MSLRSDTSNSFNTAIGAGALLANTADNNTAIGAAALLSNTTGVQNTANGAFALFSNTTGGFNTAIGDVALFDNTTGSNNIALGVSAGGNLTTGNNNIDIGNQGLAGEAKTIRIGKNGTHTTTRIAGISGATLPNGIGVVVDTTTGQLGVTPSSVRFKKDVSSMDNTSEAILSLRPVAFHYKSDAKNVPQFGLIAEEVAKVTPDLVVRDKEGKPYAVRYDAVNAMLLNEFLKEHSKVEEVQASVAQQEKAFQRKLADQQKQIEALTAGLQKVSAQLELSKPAPQTVLNQ